MAEDTETTEPYIKIYVHLSGLGSAFCRITDFGIPILKNLYITKIERNSALFSI